MFSHKIIGKLISLTIPTNKFGEINKARALLLLTSKDILELEQCIKSAKFDYCEHNKCKFDEPECKL